MAPRHVGLIIGLFTQCYAENTSDLAPKCTVKTNTDVAVRSYKQTSGVTVGECCAACTADPQCKVAVHIDDECHMKDQVRLVDSTSRFVTVFPGTSPSPGTPTPRPGPSRGTIVLVQTAKDTGDKLSRKQDLDFYDDFDSDVPIIDVSSAEKDQEIVGFGGAFTEASALVFKGMTKGNQEKFLEKYFDPISGIGYTLGRVHINSCDFSPAPAQWSEDDLPQGEADPELKFFDNEVKHDQEAMIPFIKESMSRIQAGGRNLKLFASPWSPPAWMKTNGQMVGGGKLIPEYQSTWANYFSKWITAYKNQGVPIWGITPQNEPEFSAGWEACRYTAQEEADWLGTHLGPTLNATHPEVLIFPFDHNKDHVYEWAQTMHSHPTASKYTHGIAFHWYMGDHFDNVARAHSDFPEYTLLPTEATWEKYRWGPHATAETGDWSFGEGYAHDIMGDLNAGSSGWTDWNLLLDQTGGPNHLGNNCGAPMYADNSKQELYLHPQYYYMGHFSKYILPASRRVKSKVIGSTTYKGWPRGYGTCTGEDGLQATTFQQPDGQIVVVALNCGSTSISFKIKDGARSALTQIPAHAIQTYIFNRATPIDTIVV